MAGSKFHKNRTQKSSRADLIKRAILIREKKLLKMYFDFLDCSIIKGVLIVKGICKPTDQSPEYQYTLTYNALTPPKILVDSPQIEYNDEIHMFPSDNSLCLYHAKSDDLVWDSRNHNLYDTIIPWTQEWFVYYELYNITGKWEHPHIDHRLNKSYSSASSLLILSSEEVIKAILVLLHSHGYRVYLLKDAKGFFKNHEIRHSLQMLIETGMSLFDTIDNWENRKLKKQISNTKKKWLNNTLQFLSDAAFVLSNVSTAINRIEGIKKFNDLKNAGFYVDYRNEILIPQKTVNKEDYNSILDTSNRLIIFYKQLRILFHPSIRKHLSNDKIEEIKNGLHTFINEALKDFSFKEINKIK